MVADQESALNVNVFIIIKGVPSEHNAAARYCLTVLGIMSQKVCLLVILLGTVLSLGVSQYVQQGANFPGGLVLGDNRSLNDSSSPGQLRYRADIDVVQYYRSSGEWSTVLSQSSNVSGVPELLEENSRLRASVTFLGSVLYCNGHGQFDADFNQCDCYENGTHGYWAQPRCELCASGWKMDEASMCVVNVNECVEVPNACPGSNVECIDEPGSYQCVCHDGYQAGVSGECEPCPVGTAGTSGECHACPDGTGQSADRTECLSCEAFDDLCPISPSHSIVAVSESEYCIDQVGLNPPSSDTGVGGCNAMRSACTSRGMQLCSEAEYRSAYLQYDALDMSEEPGSHVYAPTRDVCAAGRHTLMQGFGGAVWSGTHVSGTPGCHNDNACDSSNSRYYRCCVAWEPRRYAGAGGTCILCSDGTFPNDNRTACISCPPGHAGLYGDCNLCDDGFAPSEDKSECVPCGELEAGTGGLCSVCPDGTSPSEDHTECQPCVTDALSCPDSGLVLAPSRQYCIDSVGLNPPSTNEEAAGCTAMRDACAARGLQLCSQDEYASAYEFYAYLGMSEQSSSHAHTYAPTRDVCASGHHTLMAGLEGQVWGATHVSGVPGCHQDRACTSLNVRYYRCCSATSAAGRAGTGGTCSACPDGTQANSARTGCEPCPAGEFGENGICRACPSGYEPTSDRTTCTPCPSGTAGEDGVCTVCPPGSGPSSDRSACVGCETYDVHCPSVSGSAIVPVSGSAFCIDQIGLNPPSTDGSASGCNAMHTACSSRDMQLCSEEEYRSAYVRYNELGMSEEPGNHLYAPTRDVCDTNRHTLMQGFAGAVWGGTHAPGIPGCHNDASCNSENSRYYRCCASWEPRLHAGSTGSCSVCPDGTSPNSNRTGCNPCPSGHAGRYGSCRVCSDGFTPNADSSDCVPCGDLEAGTGGLCSVCPDGTSPSEDHTECQPCVTDELSCPDSGLVLAPSRQYCIDSVGLNPPSTNEQAAGCTAMHDACAARGLQLCSQDEYASAYEFYAYLGMSEQSSSFSHVYAPTRDVCASGHHTLMAGLEGQLWGGTHVSGVPGCHKDQACTSQNVRYYRCCSATSAAGRAGTGGTCSACPDGTQANSARTGCEPCPAGEFGENGICRACPSGYEPTSDRTTCTPCPSGTAGEDGVCTVCPPGTGPNDDQSACVGCEVHDVDCPSVSGSTIVPVSGSAFCIDQVGLNPPSTDGSASGCNAMHTACSSRGMQLCSEEEYRSAYVRYNELGMSEEPGSHVYAPTRDVCDTNRHTLMQGFAGAVWGGTHAPGIPGCHNNQACNSENSRYYRCCATFHPVRYASVENVCTVCPDGTQANANRTACEPCPTGTAGRSGSCSLVCGDGYTPSNDRASCEPCPAGTAGTGGACSACGPGTGPSEDRSACVSCPSQAAACTGSGLSLIPSLDVCIHTVGLNPPSSDSGSGGCTAMGDACAAAGMQLCSEQEYASAYAFYSALGMSEESSSPAHVYGPTRDVCSSGHHILMAGFAGARWGGTHVSGIVGCHQNTACNQQNSRYYRCCAPSNGYGTYSTTGVCLQCPDGQQPNSGKTACENCPSGHFGTGGICRECPSGTSPSADRTYCE